MASFLVLYGTGEGQTASVADHIAEVLADRGHTPTVYDAADAPADIDPAALDAVLVGASVHYGKHQRGTVAFVREHRETLAGMPTAFFQLSLSSADESGREEAAGYVDSFVSETGWHPDRIGLFGGALRYSEYGFLKRLMMKRIAKRNLPEAPTDRDTEFTDWAEVAAFAADVAAFVEGRLGIAPPTTDE